jgi:hypothetical protein
MWLIGIFVLLIHDFSDFFLILGRAYRVNYLLIKDFKNKSSLVLYTVYFTGFFSWIGCRIVIFSYCCVYSSAKGSYESTIGTFQLTEIFSNVLYFPYIFMSFMLAALQVLHIFWTYYIFSSFLSLTVTKKIKHTYD